jgi:hypothetical protein
VEEQNTGLGKMSRVSVGIYENWVFLDFLTGNSPGEANEKVGKLRTLPARLVTASLEEATLAKPPDH